MEKWKLAWRNGYAPSFSLVGLEALKRGLERDDLRLIQGATTTPPPLQCVQDWPAEAADAIGYIFWQGDMAGEATVGEVEEYFAQCCFDADRRLGEPAACRWFLNWFDDTPRNEMRRELLLEVKMELYHRESLAA